MSSSTFGVASMRRGPLSSRLAVLTAVSGLGLAVLMGSASLVAARSDDCPTSTDTVDTAPDDPDMSVDMNDMSTDSTMDMDQDDGVMDMDDMSSDSAMDMDQEMMGDGAMGRMAHEMMSAMHAQMTGQMGQMHHEMMVAMHDAMMGAPEDVEGAVDCAGDEHAR